MSMPQVAQMRELSAWRAAFDGGFDSAADADVTAAEEDSSVPEGQPA
jgi:hypothetical protein